MALETYLYYFHTQLSLKVFLLQCKMNTGLGDCVRMSRAVRPLRKTPICFPVLWRGLASPRRLVEHEQGDICGFAGRVTVQTFARSGRGGSDASGFQVSQSKVCVRRDGEPTILNIACLQNDTVCIVMTSWAPAGLLSRESHWWIIGKVEDFLLHVQSHVLNYHYQRLNNADSQQIAGAKYILTSSLCWLLEFRPRARGQLQM